MSAPSQLRYHDWVRMTMTPVRTIPDLDDERQVVVIEDPDDTKRAEEASVYGCNTCGIPMAGNTDSLCPGPE